MAECAIMHTGVSSVTTTKILLGGGLRCLPGYGDNGDAAHFYMPIGSLPIIADWAQGNSNTLEFYGDNNNLIRRVVTTYSLRLVSWHGPLNLFLLTPVRMSEALSSEPSSFTVNTADVSYSPNSESGVSTVLYMPIVSRIMDAISAGKGEIVNDVLEESYSAVKPHGLTANTYTIPCLAALRFDVLTSESYPAFPGAAAAMIEMSGNMLRLTQDSVVFDGTYTKTVDTIIQHGQGAIEEPFE